MTLGDPFPSSICSPSPQKTTKVRNPDDPRDPPSASAALACHTRSRIAVGRGSRCVSPHRAQDVAFGLRSVLIDFPA